MRRLNPAVIESIRDLSRDFFRDARSSHDWEHTERVTCLALRIAAEEEADRQVVEAAALLHDIGRRQESEGPGRVCHATLGARLAEKLLSDLEIEMDLIGRITHCIAAHRFRGSMQPETMEAKVVFDSDKLDSIGAVGIGRAFLFAGEVGARLHDPAIEVENTRPYTREDTAYREFLVKLRRVRGRMLTATGRRMAEDRHRFMVDYFDRLNLEVKGMA